MATHALYQIGRSGKYIILGMTMIKNSISMMFFGYFCLTLHLKRMSGLPCTGACIGQRAWLSA
jgi:hypothetical protein